MYFRLCRWCGSPPHRWFPRPIIDAVRMHTECTWCETNLNKKKRVSPLWWVLAKWMGYAELQNSYANYARVREKLQTFNICILMVVFPKDKKRFSPLTNLDKTQRFHQLLQSGSWEFWKNLPDRRAGLFIIFLGDRWFYHHNVIISNIRLLKL